MDKEKREFIEQEILTSSITGGFSRGYRVYGKDVPGSKMESLKKYLRVILRERFGSNYQGKDHIVQLEILKNDIDREYKSILDNNGSIYFGRVQKVVNLYLKYRWVVFSDPKPPHCPFDSQVLAAIRSNTLFTKMTKSQYEESVEKALSTADKEGKSIAEWELTLFNKMNY